MKCIYQLMATGLFLVTACGSFALHAGEPKTARDPVNATDKPGAVALNAADIYRQAFSALPVLTGKQQKLFDEAKSLEAPLSAELAEIIPQFEVALDHLHRARAVSDCDWKLKEEDGPRVEMLHYNIARDLTRAALLRARMRFADGGTDAAISDVLDVYKLVRDCARQISLFLFVFLTHNEYEATEVLAAHLPLLKPDQLDQLLQEMRQLPPMSDAATCLEYERRIDCDWYDSLFDQLTAKRGDAQKANGLVLKFLNTNTFIYGFPTYYVHGNDDKKIEAENIRKVKLLNSLTDAEVRQSLQQLRDDYTTWGLIAKLPFSKQSVRAKKFAESLEESKKLAARKDAFHCFTVFSDNNDHRLHLLRLERFQTHQSLLEQAIHLQRHGTDTVDPVRDHKVDYKKTANGFELRCLVTDENWIIVNGIVTITNDNAILANGNAVLFDGTAILVVGRRS